MIFENLKKRKHVYEYKDDIPDLRLIKQLLHNTWSVTPSKQNIMPYKVSVVGPDDYITKFKIYNKVVGNHVDMEEQALEKGYIEKTSEEINPHYRHVLYNPYLVVFSQRVCTEKDINLFYKEKIAEGHFMEQAAEEYVNRIKSSTAIEVGLFASNFASLCLEHDIDHSFTVCFPADLAKWKDIPFVEYPVLLLMSLGYSKIYRRDYLKPNRSDLDYKTGFENVVNFV